MGSSTSGIIDELFLQHDEKLYVKHIRYLKTTAYYITSDTLLTF